MTSARGSILYGISCLSVGPCHRLYNIAEKSFAALQGKGSAVSYDGEVRAALKVMPAGPLTILDVGANEGLWTREMLRAAGERVLRMFAFEPCREAAKTLMQIGDPRVTVVPAGLSDQERDELLYYDTPGASHASLYKRGLVTDGLRSQPIHLTTIDCFLEQNDISKVDFLKLDVEGHELSVLRGAREAMTSGKIASLAFEFGGCNIDSRTYFRDFWSFLAPLGYTIYRISPFGRLIRVDRYAEDLECFRYSNYIATRLPLK